MPNILTNWARVQENDLRYFSDKPSVVVLHPKALRLKCDCVIVIVELLKVI